MVNGQMANPIERVLLRRAPDAELVPQLGVGAEALPALLLLERQQQRRDSRVETRHLHRIPRANEHDI